MASKPKGKTSKSLFGDDDLLDSLFDDNKPAVRGRSSRGGSVNRSSATDNIFSMLAEEVKRDDGDAEDSDVSAADPNDILKNMKDIDDMDADLFASKKKPSSAPAQTKPFGNNGPKKDSVALESNVKPEGAGKKPNSAPSSTTRNYKKFTFSDLDDPFADPLDDLLPDETKTESKATVRPTKPEKSVLSPSASPILKSKTTDVAKKQSDLTFEDDKDDLMDALGFDSDKNKKKDNVLWSNRNEPPQRARTRLDEILESLTSPRLLERPPTGERKDQPQSQEKTFNVKDPLLEDDLTFGSYQPTLGSTPEGRQSRRQSVRFSTEDVSASTPEKKPKPITPTSTRSRNSADWLGLKTNDDYVEDDAKEKKTSIESPKAPSSPLLERKSSLTGGHAKVTADISAPTDNIAKQMKPEVSKSQKKEEEEDDWLAGALSRKKTQSVSNSEAKSFKQGESGGLGEDVDLESFVSKQVTSQAPRSRDDTFASLGETGNTFLGKPSPAAHSTPVRDERTKQDTILTYPSTPPQSPPIVTEYTPTAKHHLPPTLTPSSPTAFCAKVTFSADILQQQLLQQQMMQSQLLDLGAVVDTGALQRLKDKKQQPEDHQVLQACIIQLEGQVKALQLERDQTLMLLESVQQRHKQDMELMENAHKARVKLLEESAAQRETRARQECEDLMERLSIVTRSAEQERSELQAQYQRKLAQAQQERDREVERLRDLQRKSIFEMKKDHEDQVQRLKRSLTGVIEQMEQFSSRLGELSSRVESTHEHTAHGLEQGARHRDEQLRIMQDRLAQQQKAMVEERTYLKEVISRMDNQLNEQQRQLEKERWKMTAEQAKAESSQRSLEEERRSFSMQINIEREELERAKSALLEEQKSVMQLCAEERRKLAAEWARFHTQEKQRHERAEREVNSLLEKREGSIISLAQEQADLKFRTAELKQKEMAVVQERETLERLREEVDRDKERISSTAVRLKTRAQEVEAFSKLAAEKYEEGERALQDAKHVEAEHEARLRNIHSQTERLRQQEQRILQERMRLNNLQKETERLRQDPPITSLPQIVPPFLPDSGSVMPNPELTSTLNVSPPTLFNSQSMALQASLALWKYTAEKQADSVQSLHRHPHTGLRDASHSPSGMEKDVSEPDPSRQRNGVVGVLYGEFTDTLNDGVRYSVSLTESALTIQRISASPGRTKLVFNLTDCVGSRAYRGPDSADVGAYFTAYFYPFKRRWMSAGVARQRVEQGFRVALVQDPLANLREAERWAHAIRDASALQAPRKDGVANTEVRRPCRVMILVNPHSGRGQALELFTGHVQEHQNHARELVRKADLSRWDALVIMSGDGLLFEVINGLMEREDWQEAIQTPLGILPGGSGNALAASVHHYSQSAPAWNEELLLSCGFMLCKGLVGSLDLVSIQLASRQRLFSFLSLAWGFVADVDIESEKYRHVGAIRFLMGTLVRLASLKVYQGRLAYLPFKEVPKPSKGNVKTNQLPSTPQHPSLCSSLPCRLIPNTSPNQNSRHNCNSTNSNHNTISNSSNNAITTKRPETQSDGKTRALVDSLLPGLDQPVPDSWTVVKEQDFVLVLAIYQSHLAEDLWTVPGALADDGIIHLFYVTAGISRPALLRLFLAMEKGAHLACGCPHLVYEKVKALRLEPISPQGMITVDGEMVEYGPVQAQIHPGLARLIYG
ncbi:hypothetical protein PAMA_009286 [Pampus argenteus]